MNSLIYKSDHESDDGGYDYDESILHDTIDRGVKAGLISPRTPQSVAIRLLDRAGAIAKADRELLIEVYPEMFAPAPEKRTAEILFPNLEM